MKKFIVLLGLIAILACASGIENTDKHYSSANADTVIFNIVDDPIPDNTEATTRGIYTALSLSINGGNEKVWATAKNDFTLFPATVIVVVELYASDTYYEDYRQMTLISRNTTSDLDMGKTIKAEASTGGIQRYWQARMRYKIDNKAWEEKVTDSLLYDASGNYIKEY